MIVYRRRSVWLIEMSVVLNRARNYSAICTAIARTSRVCHSVSAKERIPIVKHHRAAQCFTVNLDSAGNHDIATLRYSVTSDGEVNLMATNVPESFRGKGIAAHLAKAALDFVVEEKLKARISCWYIRKYVEENPGSGYEKNIIN